MASLALVGGTALFTGGAGVAAGSTAATMLTVATMAASYVDAKYIMPKLFGKENGDKGPDGLENFRMSTTRPGAARWDVYGGRAWVPCHFMWTKNVRSETTGGGGGGGKGGPAKPFVHTVFADVGIAACNGQVDEIDTMYADESPFWSKNFNRAKVESPRMQFSRHSSGRLVVSMPDLVSQDFSSVFNSPVNDCDLAEELKVTVTPTISGSTTGPGPDFDQDKTWDVLMIEGAVVDPSLGYDINSLWKVYRVYKHGETGYNEPSHMELVHHLPDTDLDALAGFTSSSVTPGTTFNPASLRRIDYGLTASRSSGATCGQDQSLRFGVANIGGNYPQLASGEIGIKYAFSYPTDIYTEDRATAQSYFRTAIKLGSAETDFWKVGTLHRIYGAGSAIQSRIFEVRAARESSSNLDRWKYAPPGVNPKTSGGSLHVVLKVAFGDPLTPAEISSVMPSVAGQSGDPVSTVRVGGENGSFLNVDPEQTSREYLGHNDSEYQPIDPTLLAAKDPGDLMSAYLGYAYISFGSWNLGPHGNVMPRVTAMVSPSLGESVGSAIKKICSKSMDSQYSDTQALKERPLVGYSVAAGTPVVQALQPLAMFYDITIQDRGGVMTFLDREDLPVVAVATKHMNARPEGTSGGDVKGFVATRVDLADVPDRLMIKYIEPSEGNEGTESWGSRGPGESEYGSKDTAEINLATLVAWPYDVKNRARSMWRSTHMESHTGNISLPPSYLDVLPGHVITYGANDWNVDPVRTLAPAGRVDEHLSLRDILPDSVAVNVTMLDNAQLVLVDDGNGNLTGWGDDVEVISSSIDYGNGRVILEVRDLVGNARPISYRDPAVVTYRYTKDWVMKVNQSTINTYDFSLDCDLISTSVDGPLPSLDKSNNVLIRSAVASVPAVYDSEILDVASMSVGVSPAVSIGVISKPSEQTGGWKGASVYSSPNGEDSWSLIGQMSQESVWGEATGSLPSTWDHAVTDWTNTITATSFPEAYLENATDEQIESGRNWMLYGDEIIAFHEAVEVEGSAEGEVVLHGIIRGLRSTDTADKMNHSGTERLIPLQGLGVFNGLSYEPPGGLSASQRDYHHRIVPTSKTIDEVDTITTRILGNSALPSRPNLLESDITVKADSGATIKWGRRSFAQTTVFGASPLMGGEWERYEVASYDVSDVSTLVAAGTSTNDAINQSMKRIWPVGSVSATSSILNRSVTYTNDEIEEDGFSTDGTDSVSMVVRQVGSFGPSEWSDSQSFTPIGSAAPAIGDPGDDSYQSSLFSAALTTSLVSPEPIFVYSRARTAYMETLGWDKDEVVEQSWIQYYTDSEEILTITKKGEYITSAEVYPKNAGVQQLVAGGNLYLQIPSNTRLRVEINGDRGEVLSVFANPAIAAPTAYIDFDTLSKTVSFVNTLNNTYISANHGFSDDDRVLITSTGDVPGYSEALTPEYFHLDANNYPDVESRNEYDIVFAKVIDNNTFQVSDTPGGAALTITSQGTGDIKVQPGEWTDTVNELRFPPGVHKMGRLFGTADNANIYFEQGSVVIGSFDVRQTGVIQNEGGCKFYGKGVLSGEYSNRDDLVGTYEYDKMYSMWYGLEERAGETTYYRHDNSIAGITCVQAPWYMNLYGICEWRNVNIVNPWAFNADGPRASGSKSVRGSTPANTSLIVDTYAFTGDDSFHAKQSYDNAIISGCFAIATNNGCFHGQYWPSPSVAFEAPYSFTGTNNHAMHLATADDDGIPATGVRAFGTTAVFRTLTDGYDLDNSPANPPYDQVVDGDFNKDYNGFHVWGRVATRPFIIGNVIYPFGGAANQARARQGHGVVEDFYLENFVWEQAPEQDFRIVALDADNRPNDITFHNWTIAGQKVHAGNFTTWFDIDSDVGDIHWDTITGDPGDASYQSTLFSAAVTSGGTSSAVEPIFVYGYERSAYIDTLGWDEDDMVEQSWIQFESDSTERIVVTKAGEAITSAEVYPKDAGVAKTIVAGSLVLDIPSNNRLRVEINGDRGEVLSVFSNPSTTAPTAYTDFTDTFKDISSVNTSTNTYNAPGHGFSEGDAVLITSTGDLPQYQETKPSLHAAVASPVSYPELVSDVDRTEYDIVFVKLVDSDSFQVSDLPGGSALNIQTSGTGEMKAQPGEWTDTVNELRFPPGVHKMGRMFRPGDDTKIFLDTGAYVIGSFDLRLTGTLTGGDHCEIYGNGVLSGEFNDRDNLSGNIPSDSYYMSFVGRAIDTRDEVNFPRVYRHDNTVTGITIVATPFWLVKGGICQWKNVSIINPWTFNADGFNIDGARNSFGDIDEGHGYITDCYSFCGDDAVHAKHSYNRITITNVFAIAANNACFHGAYFPHPREGNYGVGNDTSFWLRAYDNHAMHLGFADNDGATGQAGVPNFGSVSVVRTLVDGATTIGATDGDYNRIFDGMKIWGRCATRPMILGNVAYPFIGGNNTAQSDRHGQVADFEFKNFTWEVEPEQDFRIVSLNSTNKVDDIKFENWTIGGVDLSGDNHTTWFDIDSDTGTIDFD